ncbi:BQ2448_4217 [Microbotryum intermedium]|uniref:BQ2448_4217 protein n=1 Tax=Microbotryum intermedium TaxID=269621 RepID=A0A238FFU0_9BASI|nr:BQ2448_4217 [Microbotryum intermedium]
MTSKSIPLLRTTIRPLQRIAHPHPIQTRSLFGLPSPFASSSSSSSTGTASPAKGTLTKSRSFSIYEESREMGYDPQQLYSIIADVDAYKSFLPFTTESRILSASVTPPPSSNDSAGKQARSVEAREWLGGGQPGEVWDLQGELQVGAMGYQEGYVSHIRAKKWESVFATANKSNIFKHLETKWSLTQLPTRGQVPRTKVELYIAYSFISPFHAAAVSALWEKVSGLMIDGFEKRVKAVYGPSRST